MRPVEGIVCIIRHSCVERERQRGGTGDKKTREVQSVISWLAERGRERERGREGRKGLEKREWGTFSQLFITHWNQLTFSRQGHELPVVSTKSWVHNYRSNRAKLGTVVSSHTISFRRLVNLHEVEDRLKFRYIYVGFRCIGIYSWTTLCMIPIVWQ